MLYVESSPFEMSIAIPQLSSSFLIRKGIDSLFRKTLDGLRPFFDGAIVYCFTRLAQTRRAFHFPSTLRASLFKNQVWVFDDR